MALLEFVEGRVEVFGDGFKIFRKPCQVEVGFTALHLGFKGVVRGNAPLLAGVDAVIMAAHAVFLLQCFAVVDINGWQRTAG